MAKPKISAGSELRVAIERLRKKAKITQAQWCQRHRLNYSTVINLMTGHRMPGRHLANELERLTGVKASAWDDRRAA